MNLSPSLILLSKGGFYSNSQFSIASKQNLSIFSGYVKANPRRPLMQVSVESRIVILLSKNIYQKLIFICLFYEFSNTILFVAPKKFYNLTNKLAGANKIKVMEEFESCITQKSHLQSKFFM